MRTLVWLSFPTTDIVNPEENEVVERLVGLLVERGMQGEFIVPGVKVQYLLEHRPKTIEALVAAAMAIGYQGNAHSLHPGLMEYPEQSEWEDGVAEATLRETSWIAIDGTIDPSRRGGIHLLKDVFGELFTSFRGAGGWTPQVMEVLRREGIRVHHTLFDLAEATGRTTAAYLGCLQVSPGRSKWTGSFPYSSPLTNRLELENVVRRPEEGVGRFVESFERMVDNYSFRGPRILFINFHPFFAFTDTIPDIINWGNGEMPDPPDDLVRSNPLAGSEQERRWGVLVGILDWLARRSDVDFVTSRTFLAVPDQLVPALSAAGVERLAAEVASLPLMRPPASLEVDGVSLSLAEAFTFFQKTLAAHARSATLPDELKAPFRNGPSDVPSPASDRLASTGAASITAAAARLDDAGPIPSEVLLDDGPVAPYPFLLAMARALLWQAEPERTILVRPVDFAYPELAESFTTYLKACADWRLYKRHLDVSRLLKHAALQLWTYKPVEVA